MQYDFWNNPLVVSAMRLKYRRSSPGLITGIYLLVLLTMGALLFHYQESYRLPPGRAFLLALLSLQFLVSGGTALFSVANSISAEVANRTLDFQRIVSLRPAEILLGKMLGEPAISYFLAIATIPFAVVCWLAGSVSWDAIAWFYGNLGTFTLLCAAVGTVHTFVPPVAANRSRRSSHGSFAVALIWVPLAVLPSMMARGTGWLHDSWLGAAVNLVTPVGSLQYLYQGKPWNAQISLWGHAFPSLVIAPLTQLVVTYSIVVAMSRRLKSPLDPPIKRLHGYFALFVFDLIVAGACYTQWEQGVAAQRLLDQFAFVHLVACLLLLMGMTPTKPVLLSWLWRLEGQQSWLRSSCLGNRSEITVALPLFCLCGAAAFVTGFVLPSSAASNRANLALGGGALIESGAVSAALVLSFGMLHQCCVALAGRSGLMLYAVCLLVMNSLPPIVASLMLYPQPLRTAAGWTAVTASLSPSYFYLSRLTRVASQPVPSAYLIAVSLCLTAGCYWSLRRWHQWQHAVITKKKARMGVR